MGSPGLSLSLPVNLLRPEKKTLEGTSAGRTGLRLAGTAPATAGKPGEKGSALLAAVVGVLGQDR